MLGSEELNSASMEHGGHYVHRHGTTAMLQLYVGNLDIHHMVCRHDTML